MATAMSAEGGHVAQLIAQAPDNKVKDLVPNSSEFGCVELGESINADEPPTTRLELWSWYAYYFGNNSAGPLSYAPLSELLPAHVVTPQAD